MAKNQEIKPQAEEQEVPAPVDSQEAAAPAEVFDLKNENEDLVIKNQELEERMAELEAENAALKNKPQPEAPEEFEFKGKKYQVLAAANIPDMGYRTAREIAFDEEAQAKLIEIESGIIREIK